MLPILVSRQIVEGLRLFLKTTFPVTTAGFRRDETRTIVDDFLDTEGALVKGPWLEIKLPFRRAEADAASPFIRYPVAFTPYRHQLRAFQRLCGERGRSTLVATGTGSGKTECFMYPLLDHCLTQRQPGIKAIVIYPMNALATDQARRFAEECSKLPAKLNVGLYTGDDGSDNYSMSAKQVITHRETIRENPPDILLTNYKMLDFLLLRPQDQRLWRFNEPGRLRYLIVDELHTFDGAQGTDLACLIRRLRDKLDAGDELACVGTSATIGDETAVSRLRDYARQVFATDFDEDAIVLEDRLSVEEYLAAMPTPSEPISNWPIDSVAELRPGESTYGVFLRRAGEIWLGQSFALDAEDDAKRLRAEVALGDQLLRLTAFHALLHRAHQLSRVRDLAAEWQQRLRLPDIDAAETLIDSLTALISAARRWKGPNGPPEHPTREHVEPLLQVRVQLWLRELRRMVADVSATPMLSHADDLRDLGDPLHLPLLHCRECHAVAWGAVKPEGEQRVQSDLQAFYQSWFAHRPDAVLMFPLDPTQRFPTEETRWLCVSCHQLSPLNGDSNCPSCRLERVRIAVWMPNIRKRVTRGDINLTVASSDCPCCSGHESLQVLGSRAASLASVMIGDLFGGAFNDDYKLIAFSDSVQDAAHRAGFFGARTYAQTLRNALASYIRKQGEMLPLPRVAQEFPSYWRQRLTGDGGFVGTFIAPNMEWMQEYQELKLNGRLPVTNKVVEQVTRRLAWEVIVEFGLRSRTGRTLERSAVASVLPDIERLQTTVGCLGMLLRENLGMLRDISTDQVRYFVLGLLTHLRQQGAFYTADLESYVREGGREFVLNRLRYMPGYGLSNRPPAMASLGKVSSNFETLLGQGKWYLNWFNKCLGIDNPLATAEYEQAYTLAMAQLEKDDWLVPLQSGSKSVWGLNPNLWQVTTQVFDVACSRCQHRLPVPGQQLHWTIGMPCLRAGCPGEYRAAAGQTRVGAYRALPRRLVPSEHTALIDGAKRHEIETSFIEGTNAWDINLLSATPTLEMGINIGHLSTVLLCSVPPAQANYLQRIGRAGRRDGNALAVTIATGHQHDLYFYASPEEMMTGQVSPPGVFLKAMAVLERQMTAYCFDRWVGGGIDPNAIPGTLHTVLDTIESGRVEGFPHNLITYVEQHAVSLIERFLLLFPELDVEGIAHIKTFLLGSATEGTLGWRILNQLNELVQTRKSWRARIDDLKKGINQLEGAPADEARDQRLRDMRIERAALLGMVGETNRRLTLNFFTDAGLLPNYAFPEEGVTLRSVILRRRELREEGDETWRYEPLSFSFQRSAQAALGELVPEARFYAAEHHLNIDQVDLKLSKPQTWRLCPSCHYSENIDESGDPHSVCPRCGNPQWADTGQRRTLLKLRQVYARADSRTDRIGDDSDQREPHFYRRQLLVDVPPESMQGAYRIASDDLPFGFEYLRNVRFREINFGEPGDGAETFHVAGKSDSRKGFELCRHCGMVRRQRPRKGQYAHTLDCPLSKPGAVSKDSDWMTSLYLFRELQSEAIRILLPLADVAQSDIQRTSLIAALNMGLRQYFEGNVQHLEITDMVEPGAHSHSARQFLVIYDRVPGGTGYLKELMRTPQNLMTLLKSARDQLADCICADHADKDGCYRCILAYRDSRNRATISRKASLKLLDRILALRDQLETVDRLSDIDTNNALGSVLEERFVASLTVELDVKKKVVNGKTGYWIHADSNGISRVWELEPQVKLQADDQVMIPTTPDFMLRPVRDNDRAEFGEWAIYLDGFGPHWSIQTDDTRKRLAVMRSGRRVWSLGWQDIPQHGKQATPDIGNYPLKHRHPEQLAQYDKLAGRFGWWKASQLDELITFGPFRLLIDYLREPKETQAAFRQLVICNAVAWLHVPSLKSPPWNDPSGDFAAILPRTILHHLREQTEPIGCGGLFAGIGTATPPVDIVSTLPQAALTSKERLFRDIGMFLCLDDQDATPEKAFETIWRGFWQTANLLQFAPRFAIATRSGIALDAYESVLGTRSGRLDPDVGRSDGGSPAEWSDVFEFSALLPQEIDQLCRLPIAVPQVGLDLHIGIEVAATAELAWPDLKVALMNVDPSDDLPEIPGWTLISTAQSDWMDRLLEALG